MVVDVVVVVFAVVDVVVVDRTRNFVSGRDVVLLNLSVEKRRPGVDDRGGMLEYLRVPFTVGVAFVLLSYDSVVLCFDVAYDLVE